MEADLPQQRPIKHHLAILQRPYLDLIIAGKKTVECRLGKAIYPPHSQVCPGDLLWLKESCGPIHAVVQVAQAETFQLTGEASLEQIRQHWNDRILAPLEFWQLRYDANAATLITLNSKLCIFKPFQVIKKDRRAWVVLRQPPKPGQAIR